MQNTDVFGHVDLDEKDVALVRKIARDLPISADLSRADLLMYCRAGAEEAITVAQARPHSFTALYAENRVGLRVQASEQPEVLQGLSGRMSASAVHTVTVRGATVARQVMPVRNAQGRIIAVVSRDAYWLAHERQRRRSKVFQDALDHYTAMVLRGELQGADTLTPFDEHDGVMFISSDRRVQYMSGIASELYRHLGYRDSLIGRRVAEIETVDHQMMLRAINERRCLEMEAVQDDLTWIRKAIPITVPESRMDRLRRRFRQRNEEPCRRLYGVFILIHDVTEMLRTQRELESKMAMIREVHHRVKNNLQVIASLMRMQARRVEADEARIVLEESVNRILSVAVVHEFLSQNVVSLLRCNGGLACAFRPCQNVCGVGALVHFNMTRDLRPVSTRIDAGNDFPNVRTHGVEEPAIVRNHNQRAVLLSRSVTRPHALV